MNEILKSIQANLYDKTSSPLAGAFIFSWITWNHRFLMVLFSNGYSVTEKFKAFNGLLYFYWDENPIVHKISLFFSYGLSWLVFPLLMASLIIWLYPALAKVAFSHTKQKQQELIEIKQAIESKRLLTVKQSNEIRMELSKAERHFHETLIDKDKEIILLNANVESLEKRVNSLTKDGFVGSSRVNHDVVPVNSKILPSEQIKILTYISDKKEGVHLSSVEHDAALDSVLFEFNINALFKLQYITRTDNSKNPKVRITESGINYFVANHYVQK